MRHKSKKIILTLVFFGLSSFALGSSTDIVLATGITGTWDEYTPLAPLPGTTNEKGTTDIQTYIPGVFNLAIGIAGVLAVLMIIIGGVEYVTTDAIQGKSEGKARIQNALCVLVIVLVSWILLYTINPKLTVFNLNIEKSTVAEESEGLSTGEYAGTGAALTSEEETTSSKNAEGYATSKHTATTKYEDGTESYTITETYTDKDGNFYTTKTTKDKNDVFSTKSTVQYAGEDTDTTLSED